MNASYTFTEGQPPKPGVYLVILHDQGRRPFIVPCVVMWRDAPEPGGSPEQMCAALAAANVPGNLLYLTVRWVGGDTPTLGEMAAEDVVAWCRMEAVVHSGEGP